uniref:Uncharacterized protein n=1 Tax=Oryza glaberrima TaxID=4538 RepID=I1PL47_ORYGL
PGREGKAARRRWGKRRPAREWEGGGGSGRRERGERQPASSAGAATVLPAMAITGGGRVAARLAVLVRGVSEICGSIESRRHRNDKRPPR